MRYFNAVHVPAIFEALDVAVSRVRGISRQVRFDVVGKLALKLVRILRQLLDRFPRLRFMRSRVAISYRGATSQFLMMTSERMLLPAKHYTVGQLMCRLYRRGGRWVDALDDSRLTCTINGRQASWFDTLTHGAEICFSSVRPV